MSALPKYLRAVNDNFDQTQSVDSSEEIIANVDQMIREVLVVEVPNNSKQDYSYVNSQQSFENRSQEAAQEIKATKTASSHPLSALFRLIFATIGFLGQLVYWTIRKSFLYLRHHPLHALLTLVLVSSLALVFISGTELHDRAIISEISEHTVNEIINASKYTRDFKSTQVASRGTEEFLRVGAPEWMQREAVRSVLFNARRANLSIEDQAVLLAIVEVESGFNAVARAPTTSACGLFQFVKATGQLYGLSPEDCMNPWLNSQAGVRHFQDHFRKSVEKEIQKLVGHERVFKTFELSYYIHHDGPAYVSSSNEVKAVILSGTNFLLRVYNLLQAEQQSKEKAPTFSQLFAKNLWQVVGNIMREFTKFGNTALALSNKAA